MPNNEEEHDARGRPLMDQAEIYEDWEEDDEDKDVAFFNLYESADDASDVSEDSDGIYGQKVEGECGRGRR
ncbi:hypothetical protein HOY80DRAFT_1058160 [Tuber brumale]|nr:hypothetical protein HOY80DRAFT_1058160 [Tuber brumale]